MPGRPAPKEPGQPRHGQKTIRKNRPRGNNLYWRRITFFAKPEEITGGHCGGAAASPVDFPKQSASTPRSPGRNASAPGKFNKATAALNNLAILEAHDGRLKQADTLLRQCTALDPEDELPRRNLKRFPGLKDVAERFRKDDLTNRKLIVEIWKRKGPGFAKGKAEALGNFKELGLKI